MRQGRKDKNLLFDKAKNDLRFLQNVTDDIRGFLKGRPKLLSEFPEHFLSLSDSLSD
jgi:hypothetical protein